MSTTFPELYYCFTGFFIWIYCAFNRKLPTRDDLIIKDVFKPVAPPGNPAENKFLGSFLSPTLLLFFDFYLNPGIIYLLIKNNWPWELALLRSNPLAAFYAPDLIFLTPAFLLCCYSDDSNYCSWLINSSCYDRSGILSRKETRLSCY